MTCTIRLAMSAAVEQKSNRSLPHTGRVYLSLTCRGQPISRTYQCRVRGEEDHSSSPKHWLIGLMVGLGLRFVVFVSYTASVSHFLGQVASYSALQLINVPRGARCFRETLRGQHGPTLRTSVQKVSNLHFYLLALVLVSSTLCVAPTRSLGDHGIITSKYLRTTVLHQSYLSPIPLVLGCVGIGSKGVLEMQNTEMIYVYYVVPKRQRTKDEEVHVQWGPPDDTRYEHSPEPRIPLHQYLITEYVSILNSPPALCSVNGITKRRSSYHTMVVQTKLQKLKSMLFFILIIPTQIRISHSIQKSIFSSQFQK